MALLQPMEIDAFEDHPIAAKPSLPPKTAPAPSAFAAAVLQTAVQAPAVAAPQVAAHPAKPAVTSSGTAALGSASTTAASAAPQPLPRQSGPASPAKHTADAAKPAAPPAPSSPKAVVPSSPKAAPSSPPLAAPASPKPAAKPAPKPVAANGASTYVAPAPAATANGHSKPHVGRGRVLESSDSEDDVPLGQRLAAAKPQALKPAVKPAAKPAAKGADHAGPSQAPKRKRDADDEDEEEADKEAERQRRLKKKVKQEKQRIKQEAEDHRAERRRVKNTEDKGRSARKAEKAGKEEDKTIKWDTLSHAGVLFPPEYTPHGVQMLYDGRPIELEPQEEEVATFWAVMRDTEYVKKPQFVKNFWDGFKKVLRKNSEIKDLKKCDFTPIYEWHMAEKERKAKMTKEEKLAIKQEKEEAEAKYKTALVDGKVEQVGNFRVEPPGLFRGRGEHPKMGMLKRRIYPRDITINIGEGEPIPTHPYPGQSWKEIRHDKTVTWLAFWKDPISTKDFKYVWLAANSGFKSESDLAKYEKARKLKDHIKSIRDAYEKDFGAQLMHRRQMAVALYFIDKLALRAGHEKDDDEADTVGCCTLKVENVECMEDDHIKFDFLGKDSIRYENTVKVDGRVYKLVKSFCEKTADGKRKKPEDQVFDTMDATDLNKRLKDLMDGLSVKVFRTYNASITLDTLLHKPSNSETVDEKKADYDRANKEVAILCNHQRSVPKGHSGQMAKLDEKMEKLNEELHDLEKQWKDAKKDAKDALNNRVNKKKEQIAKLTLSKTVKEDLKTVALGTSKINYLDPRITVAWCKRHEVPMEKIFNKSLLSKFFWAMDVDPEFRF